MDRKILKDIKKLLVLEFLFTGATSLSKVFDETGNELDDMMEYMDQKFQLQKVMNSKLFKREKHE